MEGYAQFAENLFDIIGAEGSEIIRNHNVPIWQTLQFESKEFPVLEATKKLKQNLELALVDHNPSPPLLSGSLSPC